MLNNEIRDRLRAIAEKVESNERLTLDDGIFLYNPEVPLQEVGVPPPTSCENASMASRVLQYQYPSQPDQRLRLSLSLLRFDRTIATRKGT